MFSQIIEAQVNDLHFKFDEVSGLRSIIAIHNTQRGPALGGCRIIPYSSSQDAIRDAIRLAKGMSYKAALAGLSLGGGKAVIMEPEEPYSRKQLFTAFGRFVDELGGRYITAMDSGATIEDMDVIAQQSPHVTCTSSTGSPAPFTAKGVLFGIEACLKSLPKLSGSLSGLCVAVQGLGNVGYELCGLLHQRGARLIVADIDENKVNACVDLFGAEAVSTDTIHKASCDIFSPCGLGGILTEQSISELQCHAVAGAANNQLLTPECGYLLFQRGILYAPDYLINAGGLIFVAMEHQRWSMEQASLHVQRIEQTLLKIFKKEQQSGQPSNIIADQMANAILFDRSSSQTSA
ncbi:Leu/Phe/Val dehydrogenase [Candidatus Sororendozoicomonas aggregata]|uniref:Leu/Phe/Val dehydrogenase n=1 Tax=Candidatus Sororendozoicomonas aggregata TaxID=3073239 RepID=UPI002ED5AE9C